NSAPQHFPTRRSSDLDFFDTMGTVIGIGGQGGMLDKDGKLPGIQRVLIVDSLAAAAGGAASASSNTTYIESAAGVSEGGRTGLRSEEHTSELQSPDHL